MPTIGLLYVRPDLETARRARAWEVFYLARGVARFRSGELARRKASKSTEWPPEA